MSSRSQIALATLGLLLVRTELLSADTDPDECDFSQRTARAYMIPYNVNVADYFLSAPPVRVSSVAVASVLMNDEDRQATGDVVSDAIDDYLDLHMAPRPQFGSALTGIDILLRVSVGGGNTVPRAVNFKRLDVNVITEVTDTTGLTVRVAGGAEMECVSLAFDRLGCHLDLRKHLVQRQLDEALSLLAGTQQVLDLVYDLPSRIVAIPAIDHE